MTDWERQDREYFDLRDREEWSIAPEEHTPLDTSGERFGEGERLLAGRSYKRSVFDTIPWKYSKNMYSVERKSVLQNNFLEHIKECIYWTRTVAL